MTGAVLKALMVFGLLAGTVVPASAATITFGPTSVPGRGTTITFEDLVVPTTIVGDATFTFTANGDLNNTSEFVLVDVDGFSLGTVFNEDPSDDVFDFAGDEGLNAADQTGSATILNTDFAGLIADGLLTVSFDFSSGVDGIGIRLLEGEIEFTPGTMSAVPLPASLPLVATVIAGLLFMRRRRQT